jgi:hypothetical protein
MLSIAGILQILGTFRFDLAIKRATTVELAKFNYFISLGGVLFTSLIALVAIAWLSFFESTLPFIQIWDLFLLTPTVSSFDRILASYSSFLNARRHFLIQKELRN